MMKDCQNNISPINKHQIKRLRFRSKNNQKDKSNIITAAERYNLKEDPNLIIMSPDLSKINNHDSRNKIKKYHYFSSKSSFE